MGTLSRLWKRLIGAPRTVGSHDDQHTTAEATEGPHIADDETDDLSTGGGVSVENLPELDTLTDNRDRRREHLREDDLTNLRKDPRFTLYLLETLAALETFLELYDTNRSTEETCRIIDEDTLDAIHMDVFSSIRGSIDDTFDDLGIRKATVGELGLLDTTEESSPAPDETVDFQLEEVDLASLAVSTDSVASSRHIIHNLDDEIHVALYGAVLSVLDDAVPLFDDETISTIRAADFTLHDDEETPIYDAVNSSEYDWDTLATFNENLRTVLDRANLPSFDEHVLSRLHGDIQQLLDDIRSSTVDEENVTLLPDIDLESFEEVNEVSVVNRSVLRSVCEYENENLPFMLSVLNNINGNNLFCFDEDELSALRAFYSLRERYDRNELTRSQFDQELSQLLERRTEEGRKRSAYLTEIPSP